MPPFSLITAAATTPGRLPASGCSRCNSTTEHVPLSQQQLWKSRFTCQPPIRSTSQTHNTSIATWTPARKTAADLGASADGDGHCCAQDDVLAEIRSLARRSISDAAVVAAATTPEEGATPQQVSRSRPASEPPHHQVLTQADPCGVAAACHDYCLRGSGQVSQPPMALVFLISRCDACI